jgi:hypothetical protein
MPSRRNLPNLAASSGDTAAAASHLEPAANAPGTHDGGQQVFGRTWNLGRWLFWCGLVLLGVTFWIPFATARRTARTEERAERITELLLLTASAAQPLDFTDPFTTNVMMARLLCLCRCRGVFCDDLEAVTPPAGTGDRFLLVNKHYVFQVARSPEPHASPVDAIPAVEVLAWPLESAGPGHAAFYCSELGEPAFSRNLLHGYVGLDPAYMAEPGVALRRKGGEFEGRWTYRGMDDDQWHVRRIPLEY